MTNNPDEISPEEKAIRAGLRSPMIEALEGEGITIKSLAKHLRKELQATNIKPFLAAKGHIVYSDPLDALDIQQKARMDAQKLLDCYPDERHRITGELRHSLSDNDLAWIKAIKQELQQIKDREVDKIFKSKE